jgi:hypothetical protein
MVPRALARQEIIDLLGRAAEQAEAAEVYHGAAANPGLLEGQPARRAAFDATAMQLIELAGCAEEFTRNRGEPGTTLARFDEALKPVFTTRLAHTHPEWGNPPPSLAPRRLSAMIDHLKSALDNLDPDTLRIQPPRELQALKDMAWREF